MADHNHSLMIPPAAETDKNAIEMARVWIAQRGLHCVLNVGHWQKDTEQDERNCWGIVLADLARHVSIALDDVTGLDRRESLKLIVESFNTEIRRATSKHTGQWPTMDDPAAEFWNEDER